MRKLYFLVVGLLFFSGVRAQIVNIPDANFKAKLLAASSSNTIAKDLSGNWIKIDANNDKEIQVSEALNVKELYIGNSNISSIEGITSFNNITYLGCYSNQLILLDVTSLANLEILACNSNQLTSLNVSGLKALKKLYCGSNSFTILDLSGLTSLTELDIYGCNKLASLKVNGLIALKRMNCAYNALTSLDLTGLTALNYLDCSSNQLTSLKISGIKSLTNLNCDSNKLTEIDLSGLTALTSLNCNSNQLTGIDVSGLTALTYLYCGSNKLSSLNLSGLTVLTYLDCRSNFFTNLDLSSLTALTELYCTSCLKLTSINLTGLTSLQKMYCDNNQLTSLNVSDLKALTILSCHDNFLTSLTVNDLTALTSLNCAYNQLTNLNISGLTNLSFLNCISNKLTNIDVSRIPSLTNLACNKNQLTNIDLSGLPNLTNLDCENNKLTNITFASKPVLISLSCMNNFLTSLDLSTLKYLNVLYCDNNKLTSLNLKNGRKEGILSFYFNTDLQYICADNIEITKLEALIKSYGYINCEFNTYCSFVPGGEFYTITGNNKLDGNNNGCDITDVNYPNLKFSISDGTLSGALITNGIGSYSIPVQAGSHTIVPVLEVPSYYTISPASSVVTFPTATSPFIQDFCITPNGVHPDVEIAILPILRARPGFDASYKIVYKNKGNQTQSGSVNLIFNDAVLDVVTTNPVVSGQSTNTLSWNFTDLKPFETREIEVTLNVNSPMETPAVNIDDILSYTATITSTQTDETPTDNTFTLDQTVVGSFDPNDKTCLEGSIIQPSAVGKYVHYLIRFENKGTAEAQNVVVKDIIDTSKFDVNSLVVTQGSHPFVTRITETNKVEFIFENINLPFNDATNDGYVAFKIKTKPSLVVGDSFSNTASIYFDYNFPIVTNTATTSVLQSLGNQDFEFDSYFSVYPNPAKQVLNLDIKKQIKVSSISIYNTLGQQILVIMNAQQTKQVDVSNLKTGNYFIKLTSDKGSTIGKFIKN